MTRPLIALLGHKDEPTDAVEEYCRYLATALQFHDFQMEIRRVPWEKHGWPEALRALRLQAAGWCGRWVLVQYSALAWSSRGFPMKFPRVLKILKSAGARVAIVFHDVEPYPGVRLIDRLRRRVQLRAMRHGIRVSDLAIFTVPPEKISWVPAKPEKLPLFPSEPICPLRPRILIFPNRGAQPCLRGRILFTPRDVETTHSPDNSLNLGSNFHRKQS